MATAVGGGHFEAPPNESTSSSSRPFLFQASPGNPLFLNSAGRSCLDGIVNKFFPVTLIHPQTVSSAIVPYTADDQKSFNEVRFEMPCREEAPPPILGFHFTNNHVFPSLIDVLLLVNPKKAFFEKSNQPGWIPKLRFTDNGLTLSLNNKEGDYVAEFTNRFTIFNQSPTNLQTYAWTTLAQAGLTGVGDSFKDYKLRNWTLLAMVPDDDPKEWDVLPNNELARD